MCYVSLFSDKVVELVVGSVMNGAYPVKFIYCLVFCVLFISKFFKIIFLIKKNDL